MTKAVRIENADTSDYKVIVQTWDKGYPEGSPDTLVKEEQAEFPTAMVVAGITSTRYLVVKEMPK